MGPGLTRGMISPLINSFKKHLGHDRDYFTIRFLISNLLQLYSDKQSNTDLSTEDWDRSIDKYYYPNMSWCALPRKIHMHSGCGCVVFGVEVKDCKISCSDWAESLSRAGELSHLTYGLPWTLSVSSVNLPSGDTTAIGLSRSSQWLRWILRLFRGMSSFLIGPDLQSVEIFSCTERSYYRRSPCCYASSLMP